MDGRFIKMIELGTIDPCTLRQLDTPPRDYDRRIGLLENPTRPAKENATKDTRPIPGSSQPQSTQSKKPAPTVRYENWRSQVDPAIFYSDEEGKSRNFCTEFILYIAKRVFKSLLVKKSSSCYGQVDSNWERAR